MVAAISAKTSAMGRVSGAAGRIFFGRIHEDAQFLASKVGYLCGNLCPGSFEFKQWSSHNIPPARIISQQNTLFPQCRDNKFGGW